MRVFAVSDLHLDYGSNARWITKLSASDFADDALIVAGDISDRVRTLEMGFAQLVRRFKYVTYVPGNHDLWVRRDAEGSSVQKFARVLQVAGACGVATTPLHIGTLSIVPLFGWYDYSFGAPSEQLLHRWMDYRACRWPEFADVGCVARYFADLNAAAVGVENETTLSFSHFLPRIDLMPGYIPHAHRYLYPVLGSVILEQQIRKLRPQKHVYGHSHVNRHVTIDGISYINNALGYPSEAAMSGRRLACIHVH